MTAITFYGGVNEIGGNKVLVEDKANDAKIFLDFGMSFGQRSKYFEEYLNPRTPAGLNDFIDLNLLPKLDGIYRRDLLEFSKMPVHKDVSVDAVLLSHAHQDHHSYISFLDEAIPIYCSEITLAYLRALQESGRASLEQDVVYFKNKLEGRTAEKTNRKFNLVKGKFKVNGLEVEAVPIDHSILGSMAFILYCSDATIVYGADLRLHGANSSLTQEFAEKAALEKPQIYVSEGTRIAEQQEATTEAYVKANVAKTINETKGLAIADFAFRDITRFKTFYAAAIQNERQVMIPFRDAYLIQELSKTVTDLPHSDDANILIYIEKKKSGSYDEKDYAIWEREFLGKKNTVNSDYVHSHQKEIVACLGYFDLTEFLDIKPEAGSSYIHSLSEPYNEEMALDEKRLKNWLKYLKLPKHHYHCSGHAPGSDLRKIAEKISAKTVIPIHTTKVKKFKGFAEKIVAPKYAKQIKL